MARWFKVTTKVKKEIIEYCEGIVVLVNKDFIHKNNICENEFLEAIYLYSHTLYLIHGSYKLTTDNIVEIIKQKITENYIINNFIELKNSSIKVNKNSILIFDKKINE